MCLMPANPDISGIGVRIAIYLQNLLCFFPAFWALWDGHVSVHELQSAETQSTTNLVLAFAILISCIVQAFTLGLTSYHATIILSLSWMNNTNAFIYFLLYVRYNCQGHQPEVDPNWQSWIDHIRHYIRAIASLPRDFRIGVVGAQEPTDDPQALSGGPGLADRDSENGSQTSRLQARGPTRGLKALFKRIALLLGSLHLTLMSALGIWLWRDPRSFGTPDASCAVDVVHLAIVGVRVPFRSEPLRIASLVLYSLFLIPGVNLFLPMSGFLGLYIWHNHRISTMGGAARGSTHETALPRIEPMLTRIARAYREGIDSPVFPISIGLALLLVINSIFIADVELALRHNQILQEGGGEETSWGFGQILAVLLLLLPLRDVAETVLARRLNQQWSRALRKRNVGMIRGLVEDDFDPTVPGKDGVTALQVVASKREWSAFCLIATAITRRRQSPAKSCRYHATFQNVITNERFEAFHAFIQINVDPNSTTHNEKSLLELAMTSGNWDIISALLYEEAANAIFQDGRSALLHASCAEKWDIVRSLVQESTQFKNDRIGGRTLLRVAADAGEWGLVAVILDKGAGEGDEPDHGRAILKAALNAQEWAVFYRLAGWGTEGVPEDCDNAFPTPTAALHIAVARRQWQIIELLVEEGVDPATISDNGRTLLEVATRAKAWGVVRVLANANHEVNIVFQDQDQNAKTALEAACYFQEWEVAELLLKKGAGGDYKPTVLETLCAAGRFEVAERLFPWNARTSSQSSSERPAPTQSADTQNSLDITKFLLDSGAVLDSSELAPALRMACAGGRPDIVKSLLDRDANPNLQASGLGSALHLACSAGNLEVITLLLDRNANPNLRSDKQGGPLHMACHKGNLDVVRLLLDRNADPNLHVEKLGFPLDVACSGGYLDIAKLLLDRGANPNRRNNHPLGGGLHLACSIGNLEVVRLLLDAGAEPNARASVEGLGNVLDVACLGGHSDMIKLLLDRGANPNLKSDHPSGGGLRLACSIGNPEVVRLLLDAGARPNDDASVEGLGNVLDVACLGGHSDIVKLLLDRGADPNLESDHPSGGGLHLACSTGNLDLVRLLLDAGAEHDARASVEGLGNVLDVTCLGGHSDIVKLLLDRGADPNIESDRPPGGVLHLACSIGNLDMVRLLLDGGAKHSGVVDGLGSPLHVACSKGHPDIVGLLLDRDANFDSRRGPLGTPLQTASAEGHLSIVKLLLEKGADLNLQGGKYGSALAAARAEGHGEIAELLLKSGAVELPAIEGT